MILSLENDWDKCFEEAVKTIKENKILVYPTDTIYGIGGNALNRKVIDKVYDVKGRDRKKPLSIILANLDMLLKYFDLNDDEKKYLTQNCPGPYTFILKPKEKMLVDNEEGMVGVRIPNNIFIRKVCFEADFPIISTSCNISGKGDISEFSKIEPEILDNVDLAIDGKKTMYGKGSTVINIREKKILRQGAGEFEW